MQSQSSKIMQMIELIKMHDQQVRAQCPIAVVNTDVLTVMAEVPRHEFVSASDICCAYNDAPLSIGHQQTISQPYIVALMTSLLNLNKDSKVLEVGTGSGYQTAILAKLVKKVYTVEVIKELSERADKLFLAQKYNNIISEYRNGSLGWNEHAPFDSIMVTAAAKHIPKELIAQLAIGGRLVIPVTITDQLAGIERQELFLVEKTADSTITKQAILPVRFVPLVDD